MEAVHSTQLFPVCMRPYWSRVFVAGRRFHRVQRGVGIACTAQDIRRYTSRHVFLFRAYYRSRPRYGAHRHTVDPFSKWTGFVGEHNGDLIHQHHSSTLEGLVQHMESWCSDHGHPFDEILDPSLRVVTDPFMMRPMILAPLPNRRFITAEEMPEFHMCLELHGGFTKAFPDRYNTWPHARPRDAETYSRMLRQDTLAPLAPDLEGSPDLLLAQPAPLDIEKYSNEWYPVLNNMYAVPLFHANMTPRSPWS